MTTKTKKIILISAISLTILGIAWFGYEQWKKNNPKNDVPLPDGFPTPSPSGTIPNPLGSKERVLAFQKYANSKGHTTKLVEDGLWGPKTAEAWKRFGDMFLNTPTFNTSPSTQPLTQNAYLVMATNIKTLMKGWTTSSDEDNIVSELMKLRSTDDWNKLNTEYNKLTPIWKGSLAKDLEDELNGFRKHNVNKFFAEKGIKAPILI